jgi:hypothetical protein
MQQLSQWIMVKTLMLTIFKINLYKLIYKNKLKIYKNHFFIVIFVLFFMQPPVIDLLKMLFLYFY